MGQRWRRVLLASDFSKASQGATAETTFLAQRLGCEVIVTNVQTSHFKAWLSSRLEDRHRADRLELLAERLRSAGVSARAKLASEGEVTRVLVGLAEYEKADLIVLGASEKPPSRLRRSTPESMIRHASQPVWVSNPKRFPPKHILCGIDGSQASREALALAGHLRDALDVRLSVVHAIGNPDFNPFGLSDREVDLRSEQHRIQEERLLTEFVEDVGVGPVDLRFLWGDSCTVLCAYAEEEEVDLIIAGRTGRGTLRRMVLGSTAEQLLRRRCCSLLLLGEGHDPLFEPDIPSELL